MHRLTFYPIGNADTIYIETEKGKVLVVDYADMRNPNDRFELRWDINADVAGKLKAAKRDGVDVFCITHLDNDHVCNAHDFFHLEHAAKYQGAGRHKIAELWVPAGAITEEGCEDDARIWRAEARHRLKAGRGIRVFGRPERLRAWLAANGLTLESRSALITNAGEVVPGFSLLNDGLEFFLHSPHGHRINAREVEDRNQDCVVMQATFRSGGVDTRVMLAGDAPWEAMDDVVRITKLHGRESRLDFDVFKLPHHCSYLSLSGVKGARKTEPTERVREWFGRAADGTILVSSSDKVASGDQSQPPHFQAKNYYLDVAGAVRDGTFKATMEHPSVGRPKPLVIKIDAHKASIERNDEGGGGAAAAVAFVPPRAG